MAQSVTIIGAGIIGAMAAWECARAGWDVTVIADPGAQRASDGSLVWLNASTVTDPVYADLRGQSLTLWHRIKTQVPDCPVEFPGTLLATGDGFGADQAPVVTPPQAADLAPGLAQPDTMYFVKDEGRADPQAMMDWVQGQLAQSGVAQVNAAVVKIAPGCVTLADGTERRCHKIVVAAGNGSGPLLAQAGYELPVIAKPGVVFWTNPVPPLAQPVVMTPELDLWQRADGRVLVASSLAKSTQDDARLEAARVLQVLGETFPGQSFQIERTVQRDRPVPADGFPLVGPVPGLEGVFCAVTHSGMTLAPIIAQTVLALLENRPHTMAEFALDRAIQTPKE